LDFCSSAQNPCSDVVVVMANKLQDGAGSDSPFEATAAEVSRA